MNFTPFPTLQSKRLLLRELKISDCKEILYLRSDKSINEFIYRPIERQTKNLSDAKKHIENLAQLTKKNKSIIWGIALQTNDKLIGTICLWNFSTDLKTAEVGYDLSSEHQNKGYMSEALEAVISYGFNKLNFQNIDAYTHKANQNSISLLLKNNFVLLKDKIDLNNKHNSIYRLENN